MTKRDKQCDELVNALKTIILTPTNVVVELPMKLRVMMATTMEREAARFREPKDHLADLDEILEELWEALGKKL